MIKALLCFFSINIEPRNIYTDSGGYFYWHTQSDREEKNI